MELAGQALALLFSSFFHHLTLQSVTPLSIWSIIPFFSLESTMGPQAMEKSAERFPEHTDHHAW